MQAVPVQLALSLPHPDDLFFEHAERAALEKEDRKLFKNDELDDESGEEEEDGFRYPALELHAPEDPYPFVDPEHGARK